MSEQSGWNDIFAKKIEGAFIRRGREDKDDFDHVCIKMSDGTFCWMEVEAAPFSKDKGDKAGEMLDAILKARALGYQGHWPDGLMEMIKA